MFLDEMKDESLSTDEVLPQIGYAYDNRTETDDAHIFNFLSFPLHIFLCVIPRLPPCSTSEHCILERRFVTQDG